MFAMFHEAVKHKTLLSLQGHKGFWCNENQISEVRTKWLTEAEFEYRCRLCPWSGAVVLVPFSDSREKARDRGTKIMVGVKSRLDKKNKELAVNFYPCWDLILSL